jgi:hypothetical protein
LAGLIKGREINWLKNENRVEYFIVASPFIRQLADLPFHAIQGFLYR